MNEVFGIPAGALAVALTVALGVGLGVIAVLAARNWIFFKLGIRNLPRRRGRTALIVVGLMLGTTIIAAALTTGDTMSHTIRSSVVEVLGDTDELVSAKGTNAESFAVAEDAQRTFFAESSYARVKEVTAGSPLVDGVAPAIMEDVAVQDRTSRQNEPRITVFASDAAAAESFVDIMSEGTRLSLAELGPDALYINRDAAEDLGAREGDRLLLLVGERTTPMQVQTVVDYEGPAGDEAVLLAPLATAQRLFGAPGRIQHVLVSNRGDAISGAKLSDEVMTLLAPTMARLNLEADDTKQTWLDEADAFGAAFMSLFTTFGSFSIAAGILLIFLIFVMLAAERRSELGIARAVGTRRSHLVQMYVFEGVAYDLVAAAVGALLGVAVAFGMVYVLSRAFSDFGLAIERDVRLQSVVIAYALGVLLTLVVVAISAWRVSVLNIATAVRSLPDPPKRRGRRRWILGVVGIAVGVLLTAAGIGAADAVQFELGVSLVLVSLVPIARTLGANDRLAYTTAGLAIVAFWLIPLRWFDWITEFSMGYAVFLAGGLMIVLGACWVIMYNAGLLLAGLSWMLGRVRAIAPVLRLSIAYPLRSLFRTGVTLAMFTLVVFTLVVGTTVSGAFADAWDDNERWGGGFEVRAVAAPASPVPHIRGAIADEPTITQNVQIVAAQSLLPLEARQDDTDRELEPYAVTGLDEAFMKTTTYEFGAIAEGYESSADVWRALRQRPNLAIVDATVAPRRDQFSFEALEGFQLSGFYYEDGRFDPLPIIVRDPQTGRRLPLTLIGILQEGASESMVGLSTSQRTLAPLGPRATPNVYWFDLRPGADVGTTADSIESAFLANGMDAEVLQDTLDDTVGANKTFNYLIEGFMGLGLIIGVAALGVITARAVVERRQQIGVLRSIGFQKRMIEVSLLVESSFIALTAILVGTALGLAISYNIISDSAQQASWENIAFAPPWVSLGVIFLVVYAVALLTTLAPAVRASRVYPAEALRYE